MLHMEYLKINRTSYSYTLIPWRTGSLLIISVNGGVPRGVPVVNKSPSMGLPYTLTASHRLIVFIKKIHKREK